MKAQVFSLRICLITFLVYVDCKASLSRLVPSSDFSLICSSKPLHVQSKNYLKYGSTNLQKDPFEITLPTGEVLLVYYVADGILNEIKRGPHHSPVNSMALISPTMGSKPFSELHSELKPPSTLARDRINHISSTPSIPSSTVLTPTSSLVVFPTIRPIIPNQRYSTNISPAQEPVISVKAIGSLVG